MRVSDEFKQERHHYGNASEFLKWEVVMRHGLATHLSAFPVAVAAGDVAMANGAADSQHRGRLPPGSRWLSRLFCRDVQVSRSPGHGNGDDRRRCVSTLYPIH
jgi:hypothetical protein